MTPSVPAYSLSARANLSFQIRSILKGRGLVWRSIRVGCQEHGVKADSIDNSG